MAFDTPLEVVLTESAIRDIEDMLRWYAQQGVPEVGQQLSRKIVKRLDTLSSFPEMGRVVPEFEQPLLRELIEPPFRVVYRLSSRRISVIRIWRCERLLKLEGQDD